MIQNELVDEFFGWETHMSDLRSKVQSLRRQRGPFKTPISQAGNYRTCGKLST